VLNFYRLEGESFVKDNVRTNTGGDAMQLAVTGGGGVFIGHKQHNGMIEDSGYLNYKIADAFKWTEISYGSIADNVSVTVGGSPEKIACAGLHSFSQESYTFITDVAGDQTESKTGLFTPQIANIAMKSDTEGATWLMAMNLMHIVTFDGETWKLSPPSGRSSRVTLVITTCLSLSFSTLSASRAGSELSTSSPVPVFTAQNLQFRVQVSPRIMNVAMPRPKHSPIFGQFAS